MRNPAARNWKPASVSFGITVWQYAHSTLYLRENIGIPYERLAIDARKKPARATDLNRVMYETPFLFPRYRLRVGAALIVRCDVGSSAAVFGTEMMRMHQF